MRTLLSLSVTLTGFFLVVRGSVVLLVIWIVGVARAIIVIIAVWISLTSYQTRAQLSFVIYI